jgi:hypothetical protein
MNKGTCIHFTGIQHEYCNAGRCYDTQLGSNGLPPCLKRMAASYGKIAPECPDYQDPTSEQIAAYESEAKAHNALLFKAEPICREIKQAYRGKSWRGKRECPGCGKTLYLEHRPNGHMTVNCETEGCIRFIE